MQVNPYLNFDGRCGEAFRFYQSIFGGELEMMTFGESPAAGHVPPEMHGQVLHACLKLDGTMLMGSDCPPGMYKAPGGTTVSVHPATVPEGERVFRALAEGGAVTMPFEKTFWSEGFGMCSDRFGQPWMVNVAPVPEPAVG